MPVEANIVEILEQNKIAYEVVDHEPVYTNPAMAEALNTEPVLLVLRDPPQTDLGVTPFPVDSGAIPNDHLSYAITWFLLAAVWLGMTLYLVWRISRRAN